MTVFILNQDNAFLQLLLCRNLKTVKKLIILFSIAEKNYISVSSVINIFDQYVDIKPGYFPKVLSIDKFYFGKTWAEKFACIFIDWETCQIIDIYPSRKNMNYIIKCSM